MLSQQGIIRLQSHKRVDNKRYFLLSNTKEKVEQSWAGSDLDHKEHPGLEGRRRSNPLFGGFCFDLTTRASPLWQRPESLKEVNACAATKNKAPFFLLQK